MGITGIMVIAAIVSAAPSCQASGEMKVAESVHVKSTVLPDKYNAACAMVELYSPKILDSDFDYGRILTTADIYFTTGQLLSSTSMLVEEIDGMYISSACLPMKDEYRVQVTIDYHPVDGLSLCPKRVSIEDLLAYSLQVSDP